MILAVRAFTNFLFVPGNRPERYAKALASGADLVCIDLEDSVPASEKDEARAAALNALSADGAIRLAIRINGLRTAAGLADILALVDGQQPGYLFVPMVEAAAEIEILRSILGDAVAFVPLIESVKGLRAAADIAAAPGVAAIMFGGGDFAGELGVELAWEPLVHARSQIVMACAAANIRAVDVPYIDLETEVGLAEECAKARALGFHAKAAIHPRQIDAINAAMRPAAAEIAEARAAIAAFDAANGAAIRFQGKMLEAPIIRRYRQTLSLGEATNA
ncbi:MAG TPA: CoA ester lyase [Sphingorhabdus sp.]|jgi:citrate lyase beta subunit|nr:CoA ester lyase [Sphingorhabdus sp.]